MRASEVRPAGARSGSHCDGVGVQRAGPVECDRDGVGPGRTARAAGRRGVHRTRPRDLTHAQRGLGVPADRITQHRPTDSWQRPEAPRPHRGRLHGPWVLTQGPGVGSADAGCVLARSSSAQRTVRSRNGKLTETLPIGSMGGVSVSGYGRAGCSARRCGHTASGSVCPRRNWPSVPG